VEWWIVYMERLTYIHNGMTSRNYKPDNYTLSNQFTNLLRLQSITLNPHIECQIHKSYFHILSIGMFKSNPHIKLHTATKNDSLGTDVKPKIKF
jgi:hypothetical protein